MYISSILGFLEKGLDVSAMRQLAQADNIANANTPLYKKKEVIFESEMQKALEAQKGNHLRGTLTDKRHIPIGPKPPADIQPKVQIDDSLTWRKDGNNVDIDVEMAENTKNVIRYNALIQKAIGEFTKVKKVLE